MCSRLGNPPRSDMELPSYEPFPLESLEELRGEIARLGLEIPIAASATALTHPLPVGSYRLPNRFCAQPVAGRDFLDDGSPSSLTTRRYGRLASGGFGLIWMEALGAEGDQLGGGMPVLSPATLPGFQRLLEDARSKALEGTVFIAQLSPRRGLIPKRDEELDGALNSLVTLASLAVAAGFDGIDLACCHGSLAEFLLGAKDGPGRFQGLLENRMRLPVEAARRIRDAHPDLLLGARLNVFHACQNGFGTDPEDFRTWDPGEPLAVAQALQAAGATLLNLTANAPNLRAPLESRARTPIPDHGNPDEHPLTDLARGIRILQTFARGLDGMTIVAGGFSWMRHFAPLAAAGVVESGAASLAGFGRGALAFPDGPRHAEWTLDKTCIRCGACTTLHDEGSAVGCPVRDPEAYGTIYQGARRTRLPVLHAGAAQCHFCEDAPCVVADPLGTDIPAMLHSFLAGDMSGAFEGLIEKNPLPGLTSRLSPAWMESEGACLEKTLTGHAVPILDVQAAVAWDAQTRGVSPLRLPKTTTGLTVSVVGGGPAGIAATARLLELGFHVHLHEKAAFLGGMPARVIPATRTGPLDAEISLLLRPALEAGSLSIHCNSTIVPGPGLEALRSTSHAVVVTTGLWSERTLGTRVPGVIGGLDFLEEFKSGKRQSVPAKVAVLAGGDSAMESARIAINNGATDVFVIHAGERSTLHWHMDEAWFSTPGVHAMMEWEPLAFEHDASGAVSGVRLRHSLLGSNCTLPIDFGIEAMGLVVDPVWEPLLETERTSPNLYFAGAILNGGTSVGHCIHEGRTIAESILSNLT